MKDRMLEFNDADKKIKKKGESYYAHSEKTQDKNILKRLRNCR